MNLLIFGLIVSFAIQIAFFAYAATLKTDKVTDLSYGLTFIFVSLAVILMTGAYSGINIVLLMLILLWGARISIYLFIRILKIKKDKRFDGIRENIFKFAQFWILQAVSVWIILLPSLIVFSFNHDKGINFVQMIALVIWITGFVMETVADIQKFRFKNDPNNKEKWTSVGLWKHIRHPNYLGEMTMWWAIFLYCSPLISGWQYLSVISPVYISFLLIFVTGIPTLERRNNKKYKNDKNYQEYLRSTYKLIPFVY